MHEMVPPPLKNHKIAGGTRWHTHNTEIGEETVCTSEYVGEETALRYYVCLAVL